MATVTAYRITLTATDYPSKYDAFLTYLEPYLTELENGRQGQATLLANFGRYIVASTGLTQNLIANGFRSTGWPTPLSADELVPKGYADGLSFAAALPAQAGNAGKEITTDGATASWGLSGPGAIAILNFIDF